MSLDRALQAGFRVGNYRLQEKIGQGAFGQVWRAVHHERPRRELAIKIATNPEYARQLRREARLPDIEHAQIVPILDSDTLGDPPYVVMPLCAGGSVADLLREHPHGLPEERVERILWDVVAGLSAAHAAGVIHRDIKPSNILLDADGRALLSDFGLSRLSQASGPGSSMIQSLSLEREGQTLAGTLAYLAPEVLHGSEPSPASDVYSLGIVLFEMLTGRLPQGFERPSQVRATLSAPDRWDHLFERACAGAAARPADAARLVDAALSASKQIEESPIGVRAARTEHPVDDVLSASGRTVKPPPARRPARKPSVELPDFLAPVADARYAPLEGLYAGSETAQERQREWVEKGYPLEVVMKETGIVFRLVPPGEFQMGASPGDSEAYVDEKPAHKVTISSPLYMARFPVTQRQWQAVMGKNPAHFQTGRVLQERKVKKSFWLRREIVEQEEMRLEAETKEHPVEGVSWEDCQEFLKRVHDRLGLPLGKRIRLPTEAEWEYACRAGTTESRYGSLDAIGWFLGNSGGTTLPVGQKRPNAWGLHDMIGNVWEWCEDNWHGDYKNAPSDGSAWTGGETSRVLRGGSWSNIPLFCRSAIRIRYTPDYRNYHGGFRVVLDLN